MQPWLRTLAVSRKRGLIYIFFVVYPTHSWDFLTGSCTCGVWRGVHHERKAQPLRNVSIQVEKHYKCIKMGLLLQGNKQGDIIVGVWKLYVQHKQPLSILFYFTGKGLDN